MLNQYTRPRGMWLAVPEDPVGVFADQLMKLAVAAYAKCPDLSVNRHLGQAGNSLPRLKSNSLRHPVGK